MATRFFTEEWRQWWILPRSRFVCDLTVHDIATFSMIFSTATSKLKDWYDENRSSAREFELRLSSNPVVLQRAMDAFRHLYGAGEGYEFIKKIKPGLVFQNTENGHVERYDLMDMARPERFELPTT